MRSRRRLLALGLAAALLALVLADAPQAMAAAGGGSAGFGGGGGGGGFGGGGGGFGGGHGGRGVGLYILFRLLIDIALIGHGAGLVAILLVIGLAYAWVVLLPKLRNWWNARAQQGHASRRKSARRERRTELAAAEAAEEDPAFAPDAVREAATGLWSDVQRAWDDRDRRRLHELVAPGLLAEWERRLDDFDRRGWHNRVQPLEPPKVEYVGLSNRDAKQVVVRVEARLRDYVEDAAGRHIKRTGRATETVRTREYWTLARAADPARPWVLASIEQGAEGAHALDSRLTPTPWADDQALQDESLLELTAAETPVGVSPAELAPAEIDTDARSAALDLSLADPRFSPDVLAVSVRRAVDAWAQAVDGNERALLAHASRDAVSALLHPGDPSARTRLVVRGLAVEAINISALDPAAKPPTLQAEIRLRGRRYMEDRSTGAVVSGGQNRDSAFTESWTFALGDDPQEPWQIVAAGQPMARA